MRDDFLSDASSDDQNSHDSQEWLTTFADMSMLLLTFFVLMVSMSTMEITKFDSVFSSMRETFGGAEQPQSTPGGQMESDSASASYDTYQEYMKIREALLESQRLAYNEIRSYMTTKGLDGTVGAVFDEGVITLSVPAQVLFAPGSETLNPEAGPVLRDLYQVFQDQREMMVNIKGYTDNSPVPPGARYTNNWELSALRAVNVLRWFVEQGLPVVRFTATGMGDLDPLFPNDTPENRARNRRVEFSLERKVGGMP